MRKLLVLGVLVGALGLAFASVALGDGQGPAAQHVTVTCGDTTYDAVSSPSEPAHAGQVTGTNVTIVALNTTVRDAATGEIVFQSRPTGARNPQGQDCSFAIGGVIVTIYAIVTPRS
jgi:hypothetical protein